MMADRVQPVAFLMVDRRIRAGAVAAGTKYDRSTISRVVAGKQQPSPAMRARFADFFGVPAELLFFADEAAS